MLATLMTDITLFLLTDHILFLYLNNNRFFKLICISDDNNQII